MDALTPQQPTTKVTSSSGRWPMIAGGVAVAAGAYLYLTDPSKGGGYLRCPFHVATGLWCPGCGLTRGAYKLVHGDVVGALGSNLFLPVAGLLVVVSWWNWLQTSRRRPGVRWLSRVPAAAWISLVGAFVAFGVLRNLEPFSALAP